MRLSTANKVLAVLLLPLLAVALAASAGAARSASASVSAGSASAPSEPPASPLEASAVAASRVAASRVAASGVAMGPVATPSAQPTPRMPPASGRRLILPTLSPSQTQADMGGDVYRLVCSACHGDKGQGLTDEWRSTWAPSDQNCWQSKCHALNHPQDGFSLPRAIPPVVGPAVTARFATALDLYEFVRQKMPWQDPGNLHDDEFWAVTTYLLRANGVEMSLGNLDRERAANVVLDLASHPMPAKAGSSSASPPAPALAAKLPASFAPPWLVVGGIVAVAAIAFVFAFLRRQRAGQSH